MDEQGTTRDETTTEPDVRVGGDLRLLRCDRHHPTHDPDCSLCRAGVEAISAKAAQDHRAPLTKVASGGVTK